MTLRLDLGTETISGTVGAEHIAERPFWGWLQLSDALDRMRGVDPGGGGNPSPGGMEPLHEVR